MKRNDNRGASFVMVVVAMAIVAVLAVTVLWIALMNLQMKVPDYWKALMKSVCFMNLKKVI